LENKIILLKPGKYSASYLILFYLLLWILLFEIILPVNDVFPKPIIVFQSMRDLFRDYDFGWNYLSTLSAIYLPMMAAYFLVRILFPIIMKKSFITDLILSVEWFSRHIPGIVLAMLLIYWFPQSEVTKFIFAFLISFSAFMIRARHLGENLGTEYLIALETFGVGYNRLMQSLVWKAIQPNLFAHIIKQNIYVWASLIIFEFVNLGYGLGTILRKILQFKDLSALIMMFIVIGVSIFISSQLFKFVKDKFYFWKI
jgi:ABC-type nitrate/sulfonate/bicarbonate transport system permease component